MAIDLDKHNHVEINNEAENNNHLPQEETAAKQRLFANPFSFSGRIRRLEFGLSSLVYFFCLILINASVAESSIWGLLYIPLLWFWWAQLCKRFHDRDKSGMHIITLFIPFYNFVVLLMQLFADGDPYENDYGPDPKGRNMCA